MKIAVCVKAAPDAFRIDPTSGQLDRGGPLALAPCDLQAIEAALRLREAAGAGDVVVVTLGPETADEALLKALAMGADRAVRVTDAELAGADLLATAAALAGALARESADLVLFGRRSPEGEGACLGAAVAELLRLPSIARAAGLEIAARVVSVRRRTELGEERLEAPLPAVVALSDTINEPRYPSLRGIAAAKGKSQELLAAADLGGAPESQTTVLGLAAPPPRPERRLIEDDGNAAEAVLAFLTERRLLP